MHAMRTRRRSETSWVRYASLTSLGGQGRSIRSHLHLAIRVVYRKLCMVVCNQALSGVSKFQAEVHTLDARVRRCIYRKARWSSRLAAGGAGCIPFGLSPAMHATPEEERCSALWRPWRVQVTLHVCLLLQARRFLSLTVRLLDGTVARLWFSTHCLFA